MSDPAHTRLGESLKGLADSGLATVQTRLELFSVELKEEKLRAGSFLPWTTFVSEGVRLESAALIVVTPISGVSSRENLSPLRAVARRDPHVAGRDDLRLLCSFPHVSMTHAGLTETAR